MNPAEKTTYQDNQELNVYNNNYNQLMYPTTMTNENFYYYGMPFQHYNNQSAEYYSLPVDPVTKSTSSAATSPTLTSYTSAILSPASVSSPLMVPNAFNFQNIGNLGYQQQQSTPQPSQPAVKFDYGLPTPTESNTSTSSSETTQDSSKSDFFNSSCEPIVERKRDTRGSRRSRTQYSKHQIDTLEMIFQKSHYPPLQTVDNLSEKLGLSIERISVWFQNRRAKYKKTKKPAVGPQIDTDLILKQFYQQQAAPRTSSAVATESPLTINRANNLYTANSASRASVGEDNHASSQASNVADELNYANVSAHLKYAQSYPAACSVASSISSKSNYAPTTPTMPAYSNTWPVNSLNDYNSASN